MIGLLIVLLWVIKAFSWLLFIYVILSWVLSPYHPVRQSMARIIEPILQPIRQLLPQSGPIDFSVMVLFIILILVQNLMQSTIVTLGGL